MFEILLLIGFLAAGTSHFVCDLVTTITHHNPQERRVGRGRHRGGDRGKSRHPAQCSAIFRASSSSKPAAVMGRPKK